MWTNFLKLLLSVEQTSCVNVYTYYSSSAQFSISKLTTLTNYMLFFVHKTYQGIFIMKLNISKSQKCLSFHSKFLVTKILFPINYFVGFPFDMKFSSVFRFFFRHRYASKRIEAHLSFFWRGLCAIELLLFSKNRQQQFVSLSSSNCIAIVIRIVCITSLKLSFFCCCCLIQWFRFLYAHNNFFFFFEYVFIFPSL